MKLWRLKDYGRFANQDLGATWEYVRDVASDPEDWLAVFQRDEPNATFKLSEKKPKGRRGVKVFKGPGVDY